MTALASNEWGLIISSVADGTRPVGNMGTSITPGNNTYGSYAQLLSATSDDAFGILININSNEVNATARDALVTIGVDPAGGSSYTDTIVDLAASSANLYILADPGMGGIWYYFPLKIKAGSTVAAKATVNNATVGTLRVQCMLYCQPSHPELLRVGSYVRTYGSTPASSAGTSFTSGGASEGAWTDVGTIAAGDNPWWWEVGFTINNGTMAQNAYHLDLGIGAAGGTGVKVAIMNCPVITSTGETVGKGAPPYGTGMYKQATAGDHVFVRGQASGTPDTGIGVIAYGCGG